MNRFTRGLLVASLLCSVGAHLVLIQSVAWAKMAIHYSRGSTLQTSLQKTFDGRHPCALCLKVRKASQSGPTLGALSTRNASEAALLSRLPMVSRVELPCWTLGTLFFAPYDHVRLLDSPPPNRLLA